jgi:hypothetical protein
MDRTGHATSAIPNRYRRAPRSASELGLSCPLHREPQIAALTKDGGPRWPTKGNSGRRRRTVKELNRTQSRSGGMADATDSKSVIRKGVRVQVPPSALDLKRSLRPRARGHLHKDRDPEEYGSRDERLENWPAWCARTSENNREAEPAPATCRGVSSECALRNRRSACRAPSCRRRRAT